MSTVLSLIHYSLTRFVVLTWSKVRTMNLISIFGTFILFIGPRVFADLRKKCPLLTTNICMSIWTWQPGFLLLKKNESDEHLVDFIPVFDTTGGNRMKDLLEIFVTAFYYNGASMREERREVQARILQINTCDLIVPCGCHC